MAYETKVILKSLANQVAKAKSLREAYEAIRDVANVEGVQLLPYDDVLNRFKEIEEKDK